ncbi:MAG TPA: hypothetical protein VLB46_22145 [Pyrinomonadaceae bacterium]|nr:hypothetical protein [Pyrinomonadaceae bacterium]
MTGHPSTSQLERFCVSALAEDELTAVATHVADCPSCHQRFVEELRRRHGSGPFTFTLEPESAFRHDHQVAELADGKVDPCIREIIDVHLTTCATCRETVRAEQSRIEAE